MYIGSGLVIQAPETGEDVEITLFSGYWQETPSPSAGSSNDL
jgi:hypothetical protein